VRARTVFAASLLSLLLAPVPARAQLTVLDDGGNSVSLQGPARRIIAAAPHLAELAHAAGAGEWLVAAVRGADYPPVVRTLPSVGDAAGLDFERIRQLEPDLVLAWGSGNKPGDLEYLRKQGVAVFVVEPHSLQDIARHLRQIGTLVGSSDQAQWAAANFEAAVRQLRARYADAERIRVFIEIWHQPVFTVGPAHPLSDAIEVCAARNALQDYPLLAGAVPVENVLAANAPVIVSITGMSERRSQARWDKMVGGSPSRRVSVISVTPDLLARPGPRILEGLRELCERLQRVRGARRQPATRQTGQVPMS
jgi:iron complex transport system substrate-binding protein